MRHRLLVDFTTVDDLLDFVDRAGIKADGAKVYKADALDLSKSCRIYVVSRDVRNGGAVKCDGVRVEKR